MTDVIDTTWGELPEVLSRHLKELGQEDRKRRVRMEIVHLKEEDVVTVREESTSAKMQQAQWIESLKELAARQISLPHQVDDSRQTIYSEAVRDLG